MTSCDEDILTQASAGALDAEGRDVFLVDLDGFEGPLHLLLDLARRQKVDLIHVSILDLAEQYLAFVQDAENRRMDLAADYLLMAAWLAYLKSRLLLPSEKKTPEEVDGDALAGRLAFRLARLEAMRGAVAAIQAGVLDGRDVFCRGAPQHPVVVRRAIWQASLYDLMKGFGDIQTRKVKVRTHVIKRQPVLALETARRRLAAMMPQLQEWTSVQSMQAEAGDAQDAPARSVVASFFSAALELARDRAVELRQDRPFSDVYVRRRQASLAGAMKAAAIKAAE
ncbi:MAG: ScpA family protein [Alphaproteobacteria bacterium]|nr:ScpA family protein [Alphaproteobacteria bacterium]